MISCVMPVKNRSSIVSKAVDSLVAQTFDEWELIMIDDNSADDEKVELEKVIKSYNDPRISLHFMTTQNGGSGIADARNFGNAHAKFEYIAVCDSDDLNLPERLKKTIEAFEKDDCDVVYGKILLETKDGLKERDDSWAPREFDLDYFKQYDFIPHPTSSYKRKIALDYPYNSFFRKAEDYDLFSRLVVAGYNFKYINEPLVTYCRRDDSVSLVKNQYDYDSIIKKNRDWS